MADFIKSHPLDVKESAGVVGTPTIGTFGELITTKSADMSGGTGINISASTENRSAKWKNGTQDVPEKARNQYEFHS